MAEAVLRTEMNPYRNLETPLGKATDGRDDSPEPVLVGREMVLSEGGERADTFRKWLALIKETKARLKLSIEGNNKRIADKEVACTRESAATILDEIKQWKKEAMDNARKCDKAFSETIIMAECYDCSLSGGQWIEQMRYLAELKQDKEKEHERFEEHMADLANAENKLKHRVRDKQGGRNRETELRKMDPGMLSRNAGMMDWALWQSRLKRYIKISTQGKPTELDRRQTLQDKVGIY